MTKVKDRGVEVRRSVDGEWRLKNTREVVWAGKGAHEVNRKAW